MKKLRINFNMNDAIKPVISVIIPAYHDWARLQICLDSLETQNFPSEKYEVIVVNNDPLDQPPKNILRRPIRLFCESTKGSYAARNLGISKANGSILAFTDSDCIPDINWLRNAELAMLSGCERIGGNIRLFYKAEKLNIAELYEKKYSFPQNQYVRAGFCATANMITWKKTFDRCGLFRQDLYSGGDLEWGIRASKLKIKLTYLSDVVVKHPARNSLRQIIHKKNRVNAGRIMISKQNLVTKDILKILTSLLPPIHVGLKQKFREDIGHVEWLCLLFLLWYLRVHCSIHTVLIKAQFCDPPRS